MALKLVQGKMIILQSGILLVIFYGILFLIFNTTDSNHSYPIAKNLLDRDFAPEKTSKAWVSDITGPRWPTLKH